jgi:hypothetical protein
MHMCNARNHENTHAQLGTGEGKVRWTLLISFFWWIGRQFISNKNKNLFPPFPDMFYTYTVIIWLDVLNSGVVDGKKCWYCKSATRTLEPLSNMLWVFIHPQVFVSISRLVIPPTRPSKDLWQKDGRFGVRHHFSGYKRSENRYIMVYPRYFFDLFCDGRISQALWFSGFSNWATVECTSRELARRLDGMRGGPGAPIRNAKLVGGFPYIGNVIIPTDSYFSRGVGGSTTNQLCRYVLRPWSRRRVAKEKFWKWLWGAKNHGEQWWLLLSIGVGVKIFGIEYWGQPLLQCFLIQPLTNSVDWCHKHQSVKHVQLMLIEVGMSLHLLKRFSNCMIFRWENIVCSQTGVDV